MWLPRTEKEIVDAVSSGSIEESSSFDAKRELSTNNQEIAKDICAMTVDGGVIIYGLDEDENKRVARINPIPLAGQRERIDSIVRTSIIEPPLINIKAIPTTDDPSVGFLVVLIPVSDRAPHMLVARGDNRFYGRSATGNIILTEGEVARLYQRREQTNLDFGQILDAEISNFPLPLNPDYVFLYLISKPIYCHTGFFGEEFHDPSFITNLNSCLLTASQPGVHHCGPFTPDFRSNLSWKLKDNGFLGQMGWNIQDPQKMPSKTLDIIVEDDGSCYLFCGRAGERLEQEGLLFVFSEIIAGLTLRFLSFISLLYEQNSYYGMVNIGVVLKGLKDSVIYTHNWGLEYSRLPYEKDQYRKFEKYSIQSLAESPNEIGKRLLMPFINALTQGNINPFSQ